MKWLQESFVRWRNSISTPKYLEFDAFCCFPAELLRYKILSNSALSHSEELHKRPLFIPDPNPPSPSLISSALNSPSWKTTPWDRPPFNALFRVGWSRGTTTLVRSYNTKYSIYISISEWPASTRHCCMTDWTLGLCCAPCVTKCVLLTCISASWWQLKNRYSSFKLYMKYVFYCIEALLGTTNMDKSGPSKLLCFHVRPVIAI